MASAYQRAPDTPTATSTRASPFDARERQRVLIGRKRVARVCDPTSDSRALTREFAQNEILNECKSSEEVLESSGRWRVE